MSRLIISDSGECFLFANIKNGLKFPKAVKFHQIELNLLSNFLSDTIANKKIIADPRTLSSNTNEFLLKNRVKIRLINDPIEALKSQKNN